MINLWKADKLKVKYVNYHLRGTSFKSIFFANLRFAYLISTSNAHAFS